MGQNELGMLLVLAVACAIIGISYLHKRRAQPFVDRFAQTYCETVSYVLGDMGEYRDARLATEETKSGNLRAAPLEQQSRPIRMLLEKGVDEHTIELLRVMFDQHGEVNKRLSGLNLLGKRIIPQLSQAFILLNDALTLIKDYQTVEFTKKNLDRFHLFLNDQPRVRADLLVPIVSQKCRDTFPKSGF